MKTLVVVLSLFIVNVALAQNTIDRKEKRRIEKEKRQQELEKNYQSTVSFVEGRQFVLEADYLAGKSGARFNVTSSLNFLWIDSTNIIIQVGDNYNIGYNGVGGVTVRGTISDWKMKKNDKNKSIFLQISVMSNAGIYNIMMHISPNKFANATLTGITSGKLDYYGILVALDKSKVYKAKSI